MQTRLTLRIDKQLIDFAKDYSHEQGKSVSQLVMEYFDLLSSQNAAQAAFKSTPITQSLIGILSRTSVSEKDHKKHLEEKYL